MSEKLAAKLLYAFGVSIITLSGISWAILGVVMPPYFGGAVGLMVSVAGLVAVIGVKVFAPKPKAITTPWGLAWSVMRMSALALLVTSLLAYSLPFLGDLAMRAIFDALIGDEIGPINVL